MVTVENVKYRHLRRLFNSGAIDYILLAISAAYIAICYSKGDVKGAIFFAFFTILNFFTIFLYSDKILRKISALKVNIRALREKVTI